jgi:peptidoglycan-associated lipoprotein
MMHKSLTMLLVAATLALGGCGGHKPVNPGAEAGTSVPPNGTTESSGAQGAGASAGETAAAGNEDAAGPLEGTLAQRIIYFDFDNSEIKGAGIDVVAAHAKYLAAHPNAHVRLEGHTDERGSREYNIGLGERRAQSVRRSLLLQGAADGQITTVSYGAERPAVAGHDEAAWAKNRRVEIVYLK